MNFKEFFTLLNENIEDNFDNWLDMLAKYAKPNEKMVIANLSYVPMTGQGAYKIGEKLHIPDIYKKIIIDVLKEKRLENFNWFSFCLGYYVAKKFRKEDLEMAIEFTKKMIDSGEITKSEIGSEGWLNIGYKAKDNVIKYLEKQNELSNRELERRKKRGEADLDENLVKLVVEEENIKIYYLPRLKKDDSGRIEDEYEDEDSPNIADDYPSDFWLNKNKKRVNKRHEILCKLGKKTRWCTAQPSWDAHESYVVDDIYIIHNNDKPMYQFVSCINGDEDHMQFMDVDDEDVKSLPTSILKILKKHLDLQTGCYNLKEFVENVEDLENLKDIYNNIDFISINRLISKNSGNWIEKLPYDIQIKLSNELKNSSENSFKTIKQPWAHSADHIRIYELFAKNNNLENLRKEEGKTILKIYQKILSFIDDFNPSSILLSTLKTYLGAAKKSLSLEDFNTLFKIIKEKEKIINKDKI